MKKIVAAVLAAAALTVAAAPQASAARAHSYTRTSTCRIAHFGAIAAAHVQWSRKGTFTYPQLAGFRMIRGAWPINGHYSTVNGTANMTVERWQGGRFLKTLRTGIPANNYSYALRNTPYYDSRVGEHHVWLYVSMRDLRTNHWYGCSMTITDGVG